MGMVVVAALVHMSAEQAHQQYGPADAAGDAKGFIDLGRVVYPESATDAPHARRDFLSAARSLPRYVMEYALAADEQTAITADHGYFASTLGFVSTGGQSFRFTRGACKKKTLWHCVYQEVGARSRVPLKAVAQLDVEAG